jgi:hypothetical protein
MTATKTAGQAFAAEIRKMFGIGPRTRWHRKGGLRTVERDQIIRHAMEAIGDYRGSESEVRTAILNTGYTALHAYIKNVDGYRIDALVIKSIKDLTPWGWTEYLGRMVDTGHTCVGPFELWFAQQAREIRAAA